MSFRESRSESSPVAFQYRPTVEEVLDEPVCIVEVQEPEVSLTEEAFARRLAEMHAQGAAESETRLQRSYEQQLISERARITESLHAFEHTRREYFAQVEGEIVQLALSIASKILHRESQVDPMLVTALVRIALEQIKEGSTVSVRVRPEEVSNWREQFSAARSEIEVSVISDTDRQPGDCVLDTEMGSVNFSLHAQLKEIEQGFLDVLARTPGRP